MSAYNLDTEQRDRAEELKTKLQERQISKPQDIIPSWGAKLSMKEINSQVNFNVHKKGNTESDIEKRVPTADIVGVLGPGRGDRLDRKRAIRQLDRLLDGEFDPEYDDMPVYVEFDGSFYVTSDGIHRSLLCKAVGVEYLKGCVQIIR